MKCIELPVASQGETKEEALKNIKEAIEGYLEAYLEEHVLWKKLILSKIPYSHTACMSLM